MAHQEYSIALMIFIVLLMNMNLQGALADYGGWQGAHATFYGGGDATATMEMQEEHVVMGIYIAKVMELTLQL
ncbi:hypothetical protein TanjilG_14546 [Lupinus angustifolius]|uniref:Uncharacterized protein n=1 Tax=Lupinus angustifolius TaxID=3871 RepID=A0A394DR45_LUPAN|nr:hypothetical protein TanjilG_14546 [Lupinus angustifolius]